MAKIKSFIAVKIPEFQRRKIKNLMNRFSRNQHLKFIEPAGMHITLNFVGDVDDHEVPALCKQISNAVTKKPCFSIRLHGLGAFPNFDRPRVLWIGIDDGGEDLTKLNAEFRPIIEDLGFLQEQRFTPHVTIARSQAGPAPTTAISEIADVIDNIEFDYFEADEIVVYSSVPEKSGPVYVPLSTIRLA